MNPFFSLVVSESIDPKDEKLLFDALNEDAKEKKGMDPIRSFSIFIKDPKQNAIAGLCGVTIYGCLYTDMLWVDPSYRNQDLGTKLMKEAEKIALSRGCTFATVHTMDWEALGFYQKLGYEIEFVRDGYLNDSKMFMLRKNFK